MSTKMKAFIGITVSALVLIVLFASNGGYRAARDAGEKAEKKKHSCSAEEQVVDHETIVQAEKN
jgi:hypothetical protein